MKRSKRLLGLLLAMSIIIMMFAGCTTQETALYQAFSNFSNIKSLESNQTIKFNINLKSGGTTEEKQQMDVLSMINGAPITLHSAEINESSTKRSMHTNISFDDFTGLELWVDSDISGANPTTKGILKTNPSFDSLVAMGGEDVPKEIQSLIKGKQYMVFDTNEIYNDPKLKSQVGGVDMVKMQEAAAIYEQKIAEITKELKLDTGTNGIVEDKGTQTIKVNNENIKTHQYEISLNDAELKDLITKNAATFLNNTTLLKSLKDATLEYMNVVLDLSAPSKTEADEAKAEMIQAFNEIKANLPQYAASLTSSLNNIQLLGDNGIHLDYYVDDAGNIVRQTDNSSFILDMAKINQLAKQDNTSSQETQISNQLTGVYEITLNSTKDNYNINKITNIDFPVITKTNSFSYIDLINAIDKASQPAPQPAKKPKTKTVNVYSSSFYKGYAPQSIITSGKGKITYSKGVVNISINGYTTSTKPGTKYITINGKKYTLKGVASIRVNNRIFLSKEALGKIGVYLNIKNRTVKVTVRKASLYKGYAPQSVITSGKGRITYSRRTANISINGYTASTKPGTKYITINGSTYKLKGIASVRVRNRVYLSKEALNKIGVYAIVK